MPIIVMEPVKGGTLANVPAAVQGLFKSSNPEMSVPSWAIRFVAGLPGVMMVLSGMSNMEQLLDNTSYMQEFEPLTMEEEKLVHHAADLIRSEIAIPCTGCAYCVDGCPQNIAIPQYFALYNTACVSEDGATKDAYAKLTEKFGRAGECIGCTQCEGVCPQQLPIVEHLKAVAERFEG
jgi:predicted aldo/keto reductase-like oxidoreductase